MNTFLNTLKAETNYTYTENGALTHKSTLDPVYDLFAMGAAYRHRGDLECLQLFKAAYDVQPQMALKCLFYLRDILEGQGERRFFRLCIQWLAEYDTEAMRRNLMNIPFYGRWDDLYSFVGTPLEADAFKIMQDQLLLDMKSQTPSLLAKWLKSENASSEETKWLARKTRNFFHMTARQYRKTLSVLRKRINVLERLMSENKWDEIEFDKIPSRAGMLYRNAFARHDLERQKSDKNVVTYEEFAKSADTKVNAKALYPYECVDAAIRQIIGYGWGNHTSSDPTQRAMINKYWDNLADYFQKATFDGIAVVDTSGSMCGTSVMAPINVAVSLGLYCASKAKGPFANHFITFSQKPELIEVNGIDFCDNVKKVTRSQWGMDTNIEAVFDLLLSAALSAKCKAEDIPTNIIIISDMEFNFAVGHWSDTPMPIMEDIANKWAAHGLTMPHLVFWNVDARQNNIPMKDQDSITFVSGASPVIFDMIMSGKTSKDLMIEKLNSARYERVQ